jgi:hypothetical protein
MGRRGAAARQWCELAATGWPTREVAVAAEKAAAGFWGR